MRLTWRGVAKTFTSDDEGVSILEIRSQNTGSAVPPAIFCISLHENAGKEERQCREGDEENDDCSNRCYTSFEQMKTGQKGIFSNFKSFPTFEVFFDAHKS